MVLLTMWINDILLPFTNKPKEVVLDNWLALNSLSLVCLRSWCKPCTSCYYQASDEALLIVKYGSFKMVPVTELMNIPDATFVKSTQSSATTEQTWHH